MMSIENVTSTGDENNKRCVSVSEALDQGKYLDGVVPSRGVIIAASNGVLDLEETKVPVVDQSVEVQRTGCIEDHELVYSSVRLTLGECTQDLDSRCGSCILSIAGGEDLLDSMRPIEPLESTPSQQFLA